MRSLQSALLSATVIFLFLFPFKLQSQTRIDFGGYVQTWYIYQKQDVLYPSMGNLPVLNVQNENSTGFKIRRARLNVKGIFNETFSISSWVELATETPSLLDFYATAEFSKFLNLKVGQIMMPGQSYDTSRKFSSKLLFFERSSITTKASALMGYNAFRDIGLMAYGQLGRFWYGIQLSNGLGRFQQNHSSFSEREFGSGLYAGRIDFEMVDGLEIGGHFSTNQQRNLIQSGFEPIDINRTSWSLRVSIVDILVPGFYTEAEYINFAGKDDNWGINTTNNDTHTLTGFYAEAGYRFTKNWQILGRYDKENEKPDQSLKRALESYYRQYTFGITRFLYDKQKEIARVHLDYAFGESGPMNLDTSTLVLVLQINFIP